jgi:transposase
VKPFTGEIFAMFMPRLGKECFGIFVNQRSESLKHKTLMILDGARARRLEEENSLSELSKLPAYSPELNPVERLFQELRRRLKFRAFESLDEAESYLTRVLKEFLTDKEQVKSLTLHPYIKYAQSNLI